MKDEKQQDRGTRVTVASPHAKRALLPFFPHPYSSPLLLYPS